MDSREDGLEMLDKEIRPIDEKLDSLPPSLSDKGDTDARGPSAVENVPSNSNIVDWDGENDPLNPQNWSIKKKWANIAVVSGMAMVTPLASTIFAPAVPLVMKHFHSTNETIGTLVVSVFVLGFALGPLAIGPLSEAYGRQPIYLICTWLHVVFTACCGVSNSLGMLIAFRFLAGCAGSCPLTLGAASIGDVFPPESRGKAMAFWGLGPMVGPVLGPVAGGFLSEAKGWRWVFWLLVIVSGVLSAASVVLLRETYPVLILERKTKHLRKETGNYSLTSALEERKLSPTEHFKRAVIRPLKFLYASPIVLLLSTYISILFGTLYLLLTTIPLVYQRQYNFDTGVTGLVYLGLGVGFMLGLAGTGRTMDPVYRKLTARNNGVRKPEFRLPAMMYTGPFCVISLFWYGWAADQKTHWIVPIIGLVFFGPGMMGSFMSVNTYVVEAYTRYAASAIAATAVLRSLFGAFLPLAGPKMYESLGLGWGNSVLGFIALAICPVPWLFYAYGERLRTKFQIEL